MFKVLASLACVLSFSVHAAGAERFVGQARLPHGQTLVVAEGDLEARSIGSYSVRLYEAADAPNETTFFVSGIVMPRDGTVERVLLTDSDSDGELELLVMTRSVGTGSALSARVFDVAEGKIDPLITVTGLRDEADVLEAIKTKATIRDEVKKRQQDRLKR